MKLVNESQFSNQYRHTAGLLAEKGMWKCGNEVVFLFFADEQNSLRVGPHA